MEQQPVVQNQVPIFDEDAVSPCSTASTVDLFLVYNLGEIEAMETQLTQDPVVGDETNRTLIIRKGI